MAQFLAEDELKLYRLIWMRFMASQMNPGGVRSDHHRRERRRAKQGATYLFRATGSVPKFDGFLKVYEEGKDQRTRKTRI